MLLAQECQLVWKSKKIKAGGQIILDTILLHQIGTKYREIFCLSVLRVPWSLYQPLNSEGEIEPPFLACYCQIMLSIPLKTAKWLLKAEIISWLVPFMLLSQTYFCSDTKLIHFG